MRNAAYVYICVMVMAFVVGCKDSAERSATSEVQAKVAEAARHYGRAAGLLGDRPGVDQPDAPAVDPKVAAALQDAETILQGALSNAEDASDAAKASAGELLAEVRLAVGNYHAVLARAAALNVAEGMRDASAKFALEAKLASLESFCGELAAMSDEEARQLLDAFRASRKTAAAEVAELQADMDNRTARNEALASAAEADRQAAAAIRRKIEIAPIGDRLDLDAQANDLEARYEKAQADIAENQMINQAVAEKIAVAASRLAGYEQRLALAGEGVESIASRAEALAARQKALVAERKAAGEALAEAAVLVAEQADKAVKSFEQALAGFKGAAKANSQALRSLKALKDAAQQLSTQDPQSPMKPVLTEWGGGGTLATATARTGDVALAGADAERELIAVYQRVAAFAGRVKAVCGAAGAAAPGSLDQVDAMVSDVKARVSHADEEYGKAAAAYEKVARRMLTGEPTNTRAIKWLYQGCQARALLGRYRLTGDATYLEEGRKVVTEALEGHEDDPRYAPVREIAQALGA